MNDEIVLVKQLEELRDQHRRLDQRLEELPAYDQFSHARIKREKLMLRDEIIQIESELYPDIIA